MPGPNLLFPMLATPGGAEARMFRAVCDFYEAEAVRAGSELQLTRTTIWSWKGNAGEVVDPASQGNLPNFDQLPVVRITATGCPTNWMSEQSQRGDLSIQFEAFVPGTCEDDLLNYLAAVRRAVFPTDPDRKAAAKAALSIPELMRPRWASLFGAVGVLGEGGSRYGMKAAASLVIPLQVKTW
jgi:hypothetical protein